MLTPTDRDDHLEIGIGGDQVFQFRVDNSLQIFFGRTGTIIQMEGPFVLQGGGITTEFDPSDLESLGLALKQLFMKTVASAKAYTSGRLEVVFEESLELQAEPDPQWESWHVVSSQHDGHAIHCMSDGELAMWGSASEAH